ncbi:MAG: MipA family protein [Sphingomonadales bacterium]|nr:MipA family protein [Sphingomonadales bacterium]
MSPLLKSCAAIATSLLLSVFVSKARAEEAAPKRDRLVTFMLGGQLRTRFPGADRLKPGPWYRLSRRRAGDPITFHGSGQGMGIRLLPRRSRVNFGPSFHLQAKRREKDLGAAVGDVSTTPEAGAFLLAWPTRSLRFRAEARHGIGGHRGLLGSVSADAVMRRGEDTIWSIGARVRLADSIYQSAYFGVSPGTTLQSGLPAHAPSGGVYAVGGSATLGHQFTSVWGVAAYAGYDRLLRGAAASPIVRRFGSRNQLSAGVGLTYTFRVENR